MSFIFPKLFSFSVAALFLASLAKPAHAEQLRDTQASLLNCLWGTRGIGINDFEGHFFEVVTHLGISGDESPAVLMDSESKTEKILFSSKGTCVYQAPRMADSAGKSKSFEDSLTNFILTKKDWPKICSQSASIAGDSKGFEKDKLLLLQNALVDQAGEFAKLVDRAKKFLCANWNKNLAEEAEKQPYAVRQLLRVNHTNFVKEWCTVKGTQTALASELIGKLSELDVLVKNQKQGQSNSACKKNATGQTGRPTGLNAPK